MRLLLYSPLCTTEILELSDLKRFFVGIECFFQTISKGCDTKILLHSSLKDHPDQKLLTGERVYWEDLNNDSSQLSLDIRRKLGEWTPDVVLAINGPRWLCELYPSASCCHVDSAMISRSPFIHCLTIDPYGIASQCFPVVFSENLRALNASKDEKFLLNRLRKKVRQFYKENNPFLDILNQETSKYDNTVLFALECYVPWLYAETGYQTTEEYFHAVMKKIPSDIGVLVTQHPVLKLITSENFKELKTLYPNLIYIPELEQYSSSSLYTLDYVDAIVTLSSSVRHQGAFIWEKKIITDSNLGINSMLKNSYPLSEIRQALRATFNDQDGAFSWYLTHYCIPSFKLQEDQFLYGILERFIQKNKKGIGFDFLPAFNSLQDIVDLTIWTVSKTDPKSLKIA